MTVYLKDPSAQLDYSIDWSSGVLGAATIAAASWAVVPTESGGLSVVSAVLAGNRATAVLGGGVPGHVYQVTNHITLSDGRVDERGLTIRVENR
jgi:hypothetical protein